MTLGELLKALTTDDYGNKFSLDAEVKFHSELELNMELLSVYETDGNVVNIDVGS